MKRAKEHFTRQLAVLQPEGIPCEKRIDEIMDEVWSLFSGQHQRHDARYRANQKAAAKIVGAGLKCCPLPRSTFKKTFGELMKAMIERDQSITDEQALDMLIDAANEFANSRDVQRRDPDDVPPAAVAAPAIAAAAVAAPAVAAPRRVARERMMLDDLE